jgi:hypothetical protein
MKTRSSHWASVALASVLLCVASMHCGGKTDGTSAGASPDAGKGGGGSGSGGGGVEAGSARGPCTATTDCPSGSSCYWVIGSCSPTGECFEAETGPECGAIESLCGCNGGETVTAGCGYPAGYASGPSTGDQACLISPPIGPFDAGPIPVEDAGSDAAGDGGGPPDAWTPVGPCNSSDDCSGDESCFFAIGSCSATGTCFEMPGGGECGAVEILCGCGDAGTALTGCGFPQGYASAPTTGSGSCGGAPSLDAG